MTVAELIAKLQTMPQEAEVAMETGYLEGETVDYVEFECNYFVTAQVGDYVVLR
jgi:hypothetical protein